MTETHTAHRGTVTYYLRTGAPLEDTLELFRGDGSIMRGTLSPMTQERAEEVAQWWNGDDWRDIDDRLVISKDSPELVFDGLGYAIEWVNA